MVSTSLKRNGEEVKHSLKQECWNLLDSRKGITGIYLRKGKKLEVFLGTTGECIKYTSNRGVLNRFKYMLIWTFRRNNRTIYI